MKITIHEAITKYQEGKLEEAERLYRVVLKADRTNLDANNNLGVLLFNLGRFDEAEKYYRKAIEFKPDFLQAYFNLGNTLNILGRFDEAEAFCNKALELKPDFIEGHFNLGNILFNLNKLEEAKTSFNKAIKLKLDYVEAHNNLANTLTKMKRFDEAEIAYKKAIELNPDFVDAHNNLGTLLHQLGKYDAAEKSFSKAIELNPDTPEVYNNLANTFQEICKLDEAKVNYKKAIQLKPDFELARKNLDLVLRQEKLLFKIAQISKANKSDKDFVTRLSSSPFITYRGVETELLKDVYKLNFKKLDTLRNKDARYGNGKTTDFYFLQNNTPIIKNLAEDLNNIMKQAVKSDIHINDSFLNIYGAGSGSIPHAHINDFDRIKGLIKQKYSLTYYLSLGDQNCSEPGNLKIHNRDTTFTIQKEILLSKGMIVILPADTMHSAVYNGKTDRVMVGINFYSLL
jgi:tetratricopeptide (TPR) repeat protein